MGILHVTKKKVPDVLTRRILQGLRIQDNAMLENLEDDVEKNFTTRKDSGGGGHINLRLFWTSFFI